MLPPGTQYWLMIIFLMSGLICLSVTTLFSNWILNFWAKHSLFTPKPVSLFLASICVVLSTVLVQLGLFEKWNRYTPYQDLFRDGVLLLIAFIYVAFLSLKFEPPLEAVQIYDRPTAKLWLQDLPIAAVAFGGILTLIISHPSLRYLHILENVCAFSFDPVVLLVLESLAFALSMQLCRYSRLGQNALSRAVVFVLTLGLMPILFPVLLPAWWVWHGARSHARREATRSQLAAK